MSVKNKRITLAAELASLALFRDFIEACFLNHPGVDKEVLYDLKLAVDEACNNIITHGYAGMYPGSIILECRAEADRAKIIITDFGHPFEPGDAEQPDVLAALEDRPMGGFGLYFICQSMDEVDYLAGEDGNKLYLTRWLGSLHRQN